MQRAWLAHILMSSGIAITATVTSGCTDRNPVGRAQQQALAIQEMKLRIDHVDVSIRAFRLFHHRLPDSLAELCVDDPVRGKSYLTDDMLLDIWGQSIQYDPKGPKNGGKRPDIWSLGPPGSKPGDGVIGNWLEARQ